MTDARPPDDTPPPSGEAVPCLVHDDRTATWISPTGHGFCDECRELYTTVIPQEGMQPVDLLALMSGERPAQDWLIAPIVPARKLVGIISKRGDGKSFLVLEMAVAKACGIATLLQQASDPVHVVYIDMEMDQDDLYDRLQDLGYMPDHPLFETLTDHLHYYQLVALPPLDTEAGGLALEGLVTKHEAALVVIDTVSRVISGNENDADPFRDLFRHTETRLKRHGVTMVRLDHLGKEKERGSRGSSAKEDPLDVVWRLVETLAGSGTLDLTLTKGRQGWLPRQVTVHREEHGGIVRHHINEGPSEDWLIELVERIDQLGIPIEFGVNKTVDALRKAGQGTHRRKVSQAVRVRRGRQSGSGTTPVPLFGANGGTTSEPPPETPIYKEKEPEPPIGTSESGVVPIGVPSIGRHHLSTEPDPDDFDPSLDDLDYLADLAEEDL